MSETTVEQEAAELAEINNQGVGKRYAYYAKKSGPGWLQGAITLGGGSLAGALYLGVIMGYQMMWLQPFAMLLGVIMLSAISYVALSIGKRPFGAVKKNISPALAWGWIIATILANFVWCLPQFALGTAAVQKNLIPALDSGPGKFIVAITLLLIATVVVFFYNSGNKGIKFFELVLKILVGVVVVSFFGVVAVMSIKGALDWGAIIKGFIPNLKMLTQPAPSLNDAIAASGEHSDFWKTKIADVQRDKIITGFATAVGINMTFLLPYSMLRKGWGKEHRPMAIFDLSIGMVIPFVLATGCVVIAAASQFHAKTDDVFAAIESGGDKSVGDYYKHLDARISSEPQKSEQLGQLKAAVAAATTPEAIDAATAKLNEFRGTMPEADRKLAAMIAARGNLRLADTLAPLTGPKFAQIVFGIGVLGMAISTIIILMLINGFAVCEIVGAEPTGNTFRLGCLLAGLAGVTGPFFWAGAAPALATPTSVLGGAMLPIAYFAFLLMMNSKALLGDARPSGANRVKWNVLMIFATVVATLSSVWGIWPKAYNGIPMGKIGVAILAILFVLGLLGFLKNEKRAS